MKKLVALTGAGISAESGIKTFRDADGLWEGHNIMEVASPEGFQRNPELVLDFYNQRRKQLKEVTPNAAHEALKLLETQFDTWVITQNVDDLHERAGSTQIIHLHGELNKVMSLGPPHEVYHWTEDLFIHHRCERGFGMRPHIVWFGEAVPMLESAAAQILDADIVLVIGSSMQVYPAAGLVAYAPKGAEVIYIDPKPKISYELSVRQKLTVISKPATEGMADFLKLFLRG
ncbi:MAG: Sir2 family NAD-dependent protein deacetylase [Saprospiraceae bacterium]